jgi:aminoglycoside/choline kinase family phosphotransferase
MGISVTRSSSGGARRTDLLLKRTRMHFPRLDEAKVKITAIEKGGSDRTFYRVRMGAGQSLVLVKYNLEREENRHYVQIAEFLASHQIRAPKIYFHDPDEGLIWIEDLGATDLWSYRNEPWLVRRAFYESALDEVAKLHCLPNSATETIAKNLPVEFNEALYAWEQRYFFENCLARIFRADAAELGELPALQEIAQSLAARPRVLVHRDFQSQNIIIRNGAASLIDFQGMRPGLAEYDIASLVYDPYVNLTDDERAELLEHYCSVRERMNKPVTHDFPDVLRTCAMQRLMQALGAYGFLGLVKGNKTFLDHVPAALGSLRRLVSDITGLEPLAECLSSLLSE